MSDIKYPRLMIVRKFEILPEAALQTPVLLLSGDGGEVSYELSATAVSALLEKVHYELVVQTAQGERGPIFLDLQHEERETRVSLSPDLVEEISRRLKTWLTGSARERSDT